MNLRTVVARFRGSGAGIYFAGAILAALAAGGMVVIWLRSAVPTETVLVAARDLRPGTVLHAGDLVPRQVPSAAMPGRALQQIEAAVGRRLRIGLLTGDMLRDGHLIVEAGDLPHRLAQLGSEVRAIMLPAELVPAPDRLVPGDALELTAVLPLRLQAANTQVAGVVTTGSVLEVVAGRQKEALGVLLAIPAPDVPKFALAMRAGQVTAALLPMPREGIQGPSMPAEVLTLEDLTGAPLDGALGRTPAVGERR